MKNYALLAFFLTCLYVHDAEMSMASDACHLSVNAFDVQIETHAKKNKPADEPFSGQGLLSINENNILYFTTDDKARYYLSKVQVDEDMAILLEENIGRRLKIEGTIRRDFRDRGLTEFTKIKLAEVVK